MYNNRQIRSFDVKENSSSASDASSTSNKCNSGSRILYTGGDESEVPVIYPNPTAGQLHLELKGVELEPGMVQCMDLTGRKYLTPVSKQGTGLSIQAAGLAPGLYLIRLNIGSEEYLLRFIKE